METGNHHTDVNERVDVETLTFEAAQLELEQIIVRLEDRSTGLEAALSLWERGEQLHAHCAAKLDYAAERLERVVLDAAEIAAVVDESAAAEPAPFSDENTEESIF